MSEEEKNEDDSDSNNSDEDQKENLETDQQNPKNYYENLLHTYEYDWKKDFRDEYVVNLIIEKPYPLQNVKFKKTTDDPYSALLNKKTNFEEYMQKHIFSIKTDHELKKIKSANQVYTILSHDFINNYKNHLEDPDSQFNNDYNWYFTGGILDTLQLNNVHYIIRPDALNNLWITNINNVDEYFIIKTLNYDQIYGLRSSQYYDGFSVSVIRKHFNLELVNLVYDENEILSKPIWHLFSDNERFVDCKINPYKKCDVSVLKTDRILEIYDIEKQIKENEYDFTTAKIDGFGQVEYQDENCLIFMNHSDLHLIDNRSTTHTLSMNLESCDEACTFLISSGNVYVATKHNILQVDIRNKNIIKSFHLMNRPPHIIKSFTTDNEEYIILCNDKNSVIINTKNGLPIQVPNILNTLEELKLSGKNLLDPDLESRLTFSLLGMQVHNTSKEINLYTSNFIGEIYTQKLFTTNVKSNATAKLQSWIDNLPKKNTKLYYNDLIDLSRAKFALFRSSNEEALKEMEADCPIYNQLLQDKDICGEMKELEDMWFDEEESEDTELSVPEITSAKKVTDWLSNITQNI